MKKFLLVKKPYPFFPIGLAHVMTALRKNSIPYDFVDMDFSKLDWREKLRRGDYCAIGMGGLYADFNFIADLAREAKQLSPQTPFVLGGNMTTDIRKDILFDHIPLDYAVIGEGEHTLVELIHHINCPTKEIDTIEGIVYRGRDGSPVSTRPRKPIDLHTENLHPTWDDVNIDYYLSVGYPGYEKFTAMPVLTGRGCTGRCIFCSPTNGRYRMRPMEQVIEEMIMLNKKYKFTGFAFLNEIMYPTEKMMHEFLEAYMRTGINKPWIACLRVDIGINLLRAMKEAGCIGANCGIESGNDRVLRQMRKNITVRQVKDFYRNCKEVGLNAQGSIMFGNETETEEELKQTVDLMIHEDIFTIGGALLIAYPGTEVYKRAVAQGRIEDEYTYLKNLDFSDISISGNFRNSGYLNMSAMPDDTLFKVMTHQARRQRTYNYLKYAAEKVDLQALKGCCSVCGTSVPLPVDPQCMLNCVSHCQQCYSPVYFHLYDLAPFKDHTDLLRQRVQTSRRIAVYGTGINARHLHLQDVFWLDFDRLVAFMDEQENWQGQYFFNAKVVKMKELPNLQPDLVIIADTASPAYARTNLQNIGISNDACIPLLPPAWHDFIWQLYEEKHRCA